MQLAARASTMDAQMLQPRPRCNPRQALKAVPKIRYLDT
jgi:hypothetical protein